MQPTLAASSSSAASMSAPSSIPVPAFLVEGLVAKAEEALQVGHLEHASHYLRDALALEAKNPQVIEKMGVLAHRQGRQDEALEWMKELLKVAPKASSWSNLGTALQAKGRFDEAVQCYQQALRLEPGMAEAAMNLGSVLAGKGENAQAEECFRQAIERKPELAEAWVNLGNMLQAAGRSDEALTCQDRAIALKPELVEARFNRGNVLFAKGRVDEAIAEYREAVRLRPEMAEIHGNLGNALQEVHQFSDAELSYRQAINIKPEYAEVWYNMGNLRQAEGAEADLSACEAEVREARRSQKLVEAAACYERAVKLNPNLAEGWYNLGNTLEALGALPQAECSFRRAIEVRPAYAHAHYNRGCMLEKLGAIDEAIKEMEQAIALDDNYGQARFGRALAELRSGDFARGWQHYEDRWLSPDHDTPPRNYTIPLWRGESLDDRPLLVWGEQGVGDEVQFASMLKDVLARTAHVVLDCDARLRPLFARSFPQLEFVDRVREEEAAIYAAHMPMGSLPGLFRTSEESFRHAASPYLFADAGLIEEFRAQRQTAGRRIGLAWKTANRKSATLRSIALASFSDLFALPGNQWVSLQYGNFDELEMEREQAGVALEIDRSVDQFADIDRFAAQVASLDLVISIDNSTAHLASALGKPTWLLLPDQCDWRWMQKRADSPWYPALRIFRQQCGGEWGGPLSAVAAELHKLAQKEVC